MGDEITAIPGVENEPDTIAALEQIDIKYMTVGGFINLKGIMRGKKELEKKEETTPEPQKPAETVQTKGDKWDHLCEHDIDSRTTVMIMVKNGKPDHLVLNLRWGERGNPEGDKLTTCRINEQQLEVLSAIFHKLNAQHQAMTYRSEYGNPE